MTGDVNDLANRVARLTRELHEAERDLRFQRLAALPFKPGDEVLWHGQPALVRRIDKADPGWVVAYVSPRKKDGAWSKAERWAAGRDIEAIS